MEPHGINLIPQVENILFRVHRFALSNRLDHLEGIILKPRSADTFLSASRQFSGNNLLMLHMEVTTVSECLMPTHACSTTSEQRIFRVSFGFSIIRRCCAPI